MNQCRATVRLSATEKARVERIEGALRPDDDAFVTTRVDAEAVVVEISASNVRSLLRAIDDVLANASVSEDLLRALPLDDDSA